MPNYRQLGMAAAKRIAENRRENTVERHLIKLCKDCQIPCEKRGRNGWPDREIYWPNGAAHFVETKRPKGGRYEPTQLRTHEDLRRLGYQVHVLNTVKQVDEYMHANEWRLYR